MLRRLPFLLLLGLLPWLEAQAALSIAPRNSPRQWSAAEFAIGGAPAASNPFDPDQISIRGTFVAPSGRATTVEGFWYQHYTRSLSGGSEVLTAQGAPEWRMRFTPDEVGSHQLTVQVITPAGTSSAAATFDAVAGIASSRFKSVPRIASNRRYFEVNGEPLVLNGANVCWHGARGTFDYTDWFGAMRQNGENYARLWMCPWAFGIEAEPTTRMNYRLNRAWQLDETFRIAESNGIWLMLCLDYHGMFQTVPDQFGGNNAWPNNPYNAANGGPCAAPNDFFTSTTARDIYKKRLRYIVARWGASPNLFSWQFFNEIDNAYNNLNATSVAAWHSSLGAWLKAADPFQRARNLYGIFNSVSQFLLRTALGNGSWTPIAFLTNGDPPATVGDPIPGGSPFAATLNLSGQWGFRSSGALAVPNQDAAGRAPGVLGAFFHNTAHPELRNPCRISAQFGSNARVVLHLNSVSDGAIVSVLIDGVSTFTQSVPNTDNSYQVNDEYNRDYAINVSPGRHLIEVRNTGSDWYYLDWIRLENILPATYANNWTESPVAIGVKHAAESLVYVVNPAANFPANATVATIPAMTAASIRLNNWPGGTYTAIWNDAKTFAPLGKTTGTTANSVLQLNLPTFREDIVGRIVPANRVSAVTQTGPEELSLNIVYPAAANTFVMTSPDLQSWVPATPIPFSARNFNVPIVPAATPRYFRTATAE